MLVLTRQRKVTSHATRRAQALVHAMQAQPDIPAIMPVAGSLVGAQRLASQHVNMWSG